MLPDDSECCAHKVRSLHVTCGGDPHTPLGLLRGEKSVVKRSTIVLKVQVGFGMG